MAENIYVGDYGHSVIVTITESGVALNISTASAKTIDLIAPDGTKMTKTANFYSDGSDGKLLYTTLNTDLTQAGVWQIQGSVTIAGGVYHALAGVFTVLPLPA